MPYIYKITNRINGKSYVGKTMYTIEKRWKEHCQAAIRPRFEKRPLYDAIKKYGVENFTVESLEECDLNILEEREIFWISTLGTYQNGYNATTGGDGKPFIDYETVWDVFWLTESPQITAELLSISVDSVIRVLRQFGLTAKETDTHRNLHRAIPVSMYTLDGQYLRSFESATKALHFLFPQPTCKKLSSHIYEVCQGIRNSAYGYKWKYMIDNNY